MAVDTTPERQDGEDEAGAREIGAQHPPSAPSLATYDVCQSTDGQGACASSNFFQGFNGWEDGCTRSAHFAFRAHRRYSPPEDAMSFPNNCAVVRLELTIPRCAFISGNFPAARPVCPQAGRFRLKHPNSPTFAGYTMKRTPWLDWVSHIECS